jgi:uncharacterized protein YdhG (YjbR/CyaY superfamily)
MNSSMKTYPSVDAYIRSFPTLTAKRLKAIRAIIKKTAPKAEEKIAYGMPAYKLAGRPLVYFATFQKHIGFFPTPSAVVHFKRELASYKTSKGTIQFPHDEPLPLPLIKKIVSFRVKESVT